MLLFVRPGEGRKVRREDSLVPIPEGGAWVPQTAYIHRRLACGDLVETAPPAAAAGEKTPERSPIPADLEHEGHVA